MAFFKSDNVWIHCEIEGKGVPLFFITCAPGNSKVWLNQSHTLASDYLTIMMDLRGTGLSDLVDHVEGYSVASSVKDIHAVITQKQIDRAFLIGHCSSGMITLEYYLQHPEKVAGLVFTAAEFFFEHKRQGDLDHIQQYVNMLKQDLPNTLKLVTDTSFCKESTERHPELLEVYNGELSKVPPEAIIKMFEALMRLDIGRFSQEQLSQIKVPTLLIWGSEDIHTGLDKAECLQAYIPQCRLEVIPDSGHMPMMEQPAQFNKLLTDFVGQCI